jgi:peptidoglycan/LPS O-acetylase OafA/YrhL
VTDRPRRTILDLLERAGGRAAGFDYMRLGLAATIICVHSVMTSYGPGPQDVLLGSPWGKPFELLVPMFFALSGFLVAGSWERCRSMISFLGLRVLRIFPALTMQVVLSALIIGPIFTTFSLAAYFADPRLRIFLLNMIGWPQYLLPGVFWSNPDHAVNGQIWTVPWELGCYGVLTVLAIVGLLRNRFLLLGCLGLVQAYVGYHGFFTPHHDSLGMSGPLIGLCFMWGMVVYRFRDRLWASDGLAVAMLALTLALLMLKDGKYLAPVPIAYFTVRLGLFNPPKPTRWWGDYSYGLYIFGYPVQQAVANAPALREWWINIAIALPVAFAVAFVSWHLLEKPALGLRGRLLTLESLVLRTARWRRRPVLAPVVGQAKAELAEGSS